MYSVDRSSIIIKLHEEGKQERDGRVPHLARITPGGAFYRIMTIFLVSWYFPAIILQKYTPAAMYSGLHVTL